MQPVGRRVVCIPRPSASFGLLRSGAVQRARTHWVVGALLHPAGAAEPWHFGDPQPHASGLP